MPELGSSGSARGAVSDHRPYRDPERLQQSASTERQVYSITSSARASREGGTVRPSAFAPFRLMTNSNLADW